ncbi:MAG: YolD-like family protein [Sporolactobacillus sp.]
MANKLTPGSNKRWEAMRMMLPEHIAALRQDKVEAQKVPKPMLGEDQLQEINAVLFSALSERRVVDIKYWKDGFIKSKIATPYRIDFVEQQLIVLDEFGIKTGLPLADILGVSL